MLDVDYRKHPSLSLRNKIKEKKDEFQGKLLQICWSNSKVQYLEVFSLCKLLHLSKILTQWLELDCLAGSSWDSTTWQTKKEKKANKAMVHALK